MQQEEQEKLFIEQLHTFYNEKEKSYISLKLDQDERCILINYSKSNNSEITHKTKYSFNKIKDNDIEFFYPFNNDINKLFKFLYRICKVNYYQLNFDKCDNVIMTLLCFYHKSMKFINIIIPKIQGSSEESDYKDLKEEEENNNRPCPPVINANVFIYLTKKKEENKIEIFKSNYEIIFLIEERQNEGEKEEDNQNKEFITRKRYEDFLYLSESYYLLFNGSLDDIYSHLLFNFDNNNFELRKVKKEIKIYFYVFNLKQLNNREAYFCVNVSTKLKARELEQKKIEIIKPIKIKNEVIHLNIGNRININDTFNINKNNSEEKGDMNLFRGFRNINNDNNFDEETDTKNNIDDFKNDIQTIINEGEQRELQRIEIRKNELNLSNSLDEKDGYNSEENIETYNEIKKENKLLVTKIIGITSNNLRENKVNDNSLKDDKLVVKEAFGKKEEYKLKSSAVPIIDSKEERKINEIKNKTNKNFNFINSIIINYVDINNAKKRNELYNFVLDNINNEQYQNLNQINNNEEKKEENNFQNIHKINLGKIKHRAKKEKKINKIQTKFLMRKRKNNYTINKYFMEKPINQEKEI